MSLSSLGLTELEETVYRALLRGGDVDPDASEAAVARLAELELVHLDEEGRAVAVDPDIGISRLIRRRLLQTNAEQRRISAAWETLHELTAEGRTSDSVVSVEKIDGLDAVNERLWSMALDAREVLAVRPSRRRISTDMMPAYLQRLAEGVQWRTIIARQSLTDQAVIEYCTRLHRAGDRHRVVDYAGQQMVIFDRSVVFVPTVPNALRSGALMIRQPGAVATMVDLFEQLWAHAADLEPDTAPLLSSRERQVLHLLSSADKDEIAAREMGVSLRTYRRYVAELLVRLGATNRFQAALLARKQGWI